MMKVVRGLFKSPLTVIFHMELDDNRFVTAKLKIPSLIAFYYDRLIITFIIDKWTSYFLD